MRQQRRMKNIMASEKCNNTVGVGVRRGEGIVCFGFGAPLHFPPAHNVYPRASQESIWRPPGPLYYYGRRIKQKLAVALAPYCNAPSASSLKEEGYYGRGTTKP